MFGSLDGNIKFLLEAEEYNHNQCQQFNNLIIILIIDDQHHHFSRREDKLVMSAATAAVQATKSKTVLLETNQSFQMDKLEVS